MFHLTSAIIGGVAVLVVLFIAAVVIAYFLDMRLEQLVEEYDYTRTPEAPDNKKEWATKEKPQGNCVDMAEYFARRGRG